VFTTGLIAHPNYLKLRFCIPDTLKSKKKGEKLFTRRKFILGMLALAAASQLPRLYNFIIVDKRLELRSGWIMMKDDR